MIMVEDLSFTSPKAAKPALRGLHFQIARGEIFGFLGPSGAGKSTTQKILIGLLKDYQGRVSVFGKDLKTWLIKELIEEQRSAGKTVFLTTFYFVGGLILLEKGEGTLEAQVVTPSRSWEYVASKVGTLTLLGVVENIVIVMLIAGFGFNLLPLAVSLILTAMLYCLAGIIAVVRYASINEYLMPSVLYTSRLLAPLLPYLMQWDAWLLYLHPLQATLLLAQAAFQPLAHWQVVYGVLYAALWIGLLAHFSRRAFRRFIIAGAGEANARLYLVAGLVYQLCLLFLLLRRFNRLVV
jgi:fluoroquinolone transport system permease protein